MNVAIIILAAGHGSRMKSAHPKVLHEIGSAPMLWHSMRRARDIDANRLLVVVGDGGEAVATSALAYAPECEIVWQKDQNGTGHAVLKARAPLKDFDGDVIVLYGDTPFIRPETLTAMLETRAAGAGVVVLGFEASNPGGYGRLVMNNGTLEEIVEAKDCTAAQREITFCNSGVICAPANVLFPLLEQVGSDNAGGEVYLTDIIGLARANDLSCTAIRCDESETMGVNSRRDLARAEAEFQRITSARMFDKGVTITRPESVHFAFDTEVGRDTVIEPNVFFGRNVSVADNAHIRAFSHLEGAHVSASAQIGPFARLRPGADIESGAKVGNFVEIKASTICEGAKVSHLTYVGDARVGAETNIGAGTIFCNYDGVNKHHIEVGERVFIGSNSALVAPVTLGDDAFIATGSVVTKDVPAGDMAFARARQVNKDGLGKRIMERLKAIKAAQK